MTLISPEYERPVGAHPPLPSPAFRSTRAVDDGHEFDIRLPGPGETVFFDV